MKTPRVPLCLPCCYARPTKVEVCHVPGRITKDQADPHKLCKPSTLQIQICIWTFPKLPSSEVHHVPLISQEHHWQIPIIHYHYHYHPLLLLPLPPFPLPSSELTCLRCTMSPLLPRSTIGYYPRTIPITHHPLTLPLPSTIPITFF